MSCYGYSFVYGLCGDDFGLPPLSPPYFYVVQSTRSREEEPQPLPTLYPKSIFDGVNGYVNCGLLPELNDNNDSFIFEATMQRDSLGAIVAISNFTNSIRRLELVYFGDGNLYFVVGESSISYISYFLNDLLPHNICGVYDGSGVTQSDRLKLYVDYELVTPASVSGLAPSSLTLYNNNFKIGNSNDGYSDGCIFDVKVTVKGVEILSVPIPHLEIGWKDNGDGTYTKIDLTVLGGVTGGTDANGSTWLYDKGYVDTSTNGGGDEPKSPAFELANPLEIEYVEYFGADDPKTQWIYEESNLCQDGQPVVATIRLLADKNGVILADKNGVMFPTKA